MRKNGIVNKYEYVKEKITMDNKRKKRHFYATKNGTENSKPLQNQK